MANTLDISLAYQPESSRLWVKILQETISSEHPNSYIVAYVLPGRKSSRRGLLKDCWREQMILEVDPSEITQRILEIFVYDVNQNLPRQQILGITTQGPPPECLGSVQILLKHVNATKAITFNEELRKCDLRSTKAKNICDVLKFKENTIAFWKENVSDVMFTYVQQKIIQPATEFALSEIENSRAPVLYLIGRSGEGKSSLINGLANKYVAKVGHTKPTTSKANRHFIEFEGGTTWQVYDTRGLSETRTPDGAKGDYRETVTQAKQEIIEYKPDAIMFVSAKGVRNCIEELNNLEQILNSVKLSGGSLPPVVAVVTHADELHGKKKWPPETFPEKQELLIKVLDAAKDVMNATEYSSIDTEKPYCGYSLNSEKPFLFVVPVAVPPEDDGDSWNIETLSLVVGRMLPNEAKYQFYKAQKRIKLMKEYTNEYIWMFTGIAAAMSVSTAGLDTLLLISIQLLMISYIGWMSGRELSLQVAAEYLSAMDLTFAVGQGFLKVAQVLTNFIPFVIGSVVGASLSGASTYAMGKSAQAYFFESKRRDPSEFEREANDQVARHNPPTTST